MVRGDLMLLREAESSEEILLRLVERNRPLSPRVRLFLQESEWNCDCGSDDDPCIHVAAAVIAYKQGKILEKSADSPAAQNVARLEYRFRRVDVPPPMKNAFSSPSRTAASDPRNTEPLLKGLLFDRVIKGPGFEEVLAGTLTSYVGGVSTGRIRGPIIAASKEDYALDSVVRAPNSRALDRLTMQNLITALEPMENIFLDGQPIKTSRKTVGIKARLLDEGPGFRFAAFSNPQSR